MDERQLQIVLRARDEASRVLRGVAEETDGLTSLFKNNYKQAGVMAAGVIAGLGVMTKAAIDNAASYEQNRIAFESMLGSADKARKLLEQVSDFARKTPFELPQVVEGSKRLIAYGISMKEVIPTFKMLGDIAAGVGTDKLPQLITAFGQVQAKGKLMGTELLQFTEAGVNLGGQLQESFGVTREELEKMISSGQVTSAQVTAALRTMTSEGGLFFQGMERQATSFNGVMSNINDTFGRLVRQVVGISEQGDIRQGSIFYYVKIGAERLLPILEELTPKITAFIEAILKNKEIVVAIAGAIAGLLILALVALIAAFGSVLLVMAAVAAVGAAIALMLMKWWEWFNKVRTVVEDLTKPVGAMVRQWQAAARILGVNVVGALQMFFDLLTGGDPVLRGHHHDLVGLAKALAGVRDGALAVIDGAEAFMAWLGTVPAKIRAFVEQTVIFFQELPGRVGRFFYDLFVTQLPYAVGYAAGYLASAIPQIVENVVAWFQALPSRIVTVWEAVRFAIAQAVIAVGAFLVVAIPALIAMIVAQFVALWTHTVTLFTVIKDAIISRMVGTGQAVQQEVTSWPDRIHAAASAIPGIVAAIFETAKQAAITKMTEMFGVVSDWWEKIKGIFEGIKKAAGEAVDAVSRGFSAGKNAGINKFAEGTNYAPGGVALVGEKGPELVYLPRGSQVIPNHEIGQQAGGPAVQIGTVVIRQDSDIETLARRLDFYRRTGGGR